jgi:hypothetical protein
MSLRKLKRIFVASWLLAVLLLGSLSSAFAQVALKGHPVHVPEIDPSMAISGLAMLSGGVLLLMDRFRRSR